MDREVYNYIQEIKKYPVLSKEEQKELMIEIKRGNKEAFLKLYHCNLKLVVDIAKLYFNYKISLSQMDLIQEGNLGLLDAIEKYNMEFIDIYKFSTYAYKYIKKYILRSIYNYGYTIRIPVNKFSEFKMFKQKYNNLLEKLKRVPTIDELSQELNMSKKTILKFLNLENKLYIDSLNAFIYDDNEYMNFIPLNIDLEKDTLNKITEDNLKNIFHEILTEKQEQIIMLKYGFLDGISGGPQEVADILGYPDRRYVYEI